MAQRQAPPVVVHNLLEAAQALNSRPVPRVLNNKVLDLDRKVLARKWAADPAQARKARVLPDLARANNNWPRCVPVEDCQSTQTWQSTSGFTLKNSACASRAVNMEHGRLSLCCITYAFIQ